MIRDKEIRSWRGAEALLAIPREIVKGNESAVGDEDHIQQTMSDDDIVCRFDHPHERSVIHARWRRTITTTTDKHGIVRTDFPGRVRWHVEGLFDSCHVEVRVWIPWWKIADESQSVRFIVTRMRVPTNLSTGIRVHPIGWGIVELPDIY